MSKVKILSKNDTETILKKLSFNDIINSSLKAFYAHSNNLSDSPHRISINSENFSSLFMPSMIKNSGQVCKIVSIPKKGSRGLASSTVVFDEEGSVQWLVNSELLTAVRTAAGSALTAKILAQKRSETMTVFGSGIQAEYHIRLISQTCPNLKRINIVNRSSVRAQELVSKLEKELNLEFHVFTQSQDPLVVDAIKQAVQNSQVISTCTPSFEPIVFGDWIAPNTHICSVGSYTPEMHEFDNNLVERCKIVLVDSIDSANIEAGELIHAQKTGVDFTMTELGKLIDVESNSVMLDEILSQEVSNESKNITLFKSVGIPSQDVTITLAIVEFAKLLNLGTEVDF